MDIIEKLRIIILQSETPGGRLFDFCIQVLILASTISFTISTIPSLTIEQQNLLAKIEVFCIAVFTIEYCLRVCLTNRRASYIFSFYGIIDLIAILPFYLASGYDMRAIRAFRLLRLFRLLKLARYNAAIQRIGTALKLAKEELLIYFSTSLVIIYLSAVGIYYFENEVQPEQFASVPHALWWAVATLTTVGYGDVYPITAGGKLFTFIVLMLGLSLVAAPAGVVASALSRARELEKTETKRGGECR